MYIEWHTPKKGIRPILNLVSRMKKVWATPFDTSKWGEVRNTMSHIATPLFSQPPRNTMSTHHNHWQLAMRIHLQHWRTMTSLNESTPTTSMSVTWHKHQQFGISMGSQGLSNWERACSLDRMVRDHHLEISKGLLKGRGGVSGSFISTATYIFP